MTFLWYDLETFGRDPRYDRVAQFAAVRTDENFKALEDPILLYGKLSPDYLPDPSACLITGITPLSTAGKGLNEFELIRAIDRHFSRPGTCALGYNTIRFDDEFIRNLYYRNFFDPYHREWANGNSRWDIINLARATRDLRPEGMTWPRDEEGRPSVKLELLAEANALTHERAHDALSDVHATMGVARLIREKQPKIFHWALSHRTKDTIRGLIDLKNRTPLLHSAGMFFSEKGATNLICPLMNDPERKNSILFFDLRYDPDLLLSLRADEVRRRVFARKEDLEANGLERIALGELNINRLPFLAPYKALDGEAADRLGIDLPLALERWERLRRDGALNAKLWDVYSQRPARGALDDPDFQLYDGFFPDEDRALFKNIRETPPPRLMTFHTEGRDSRIPEMLKRFIGRNFPEALDGEGRRWWKEFCASRLLSPPLSSALNLDGYRERLKACRFEAEPGKESIIEDLEQYGDMLYGMILKETISE